MAEWTFAGMIDSFLEWRPPAMIGACLKYRSVSTIQIDYPFIGLINRVFQILILIWALTGVFVDRKWAYHETPMSTVNAYGGAGSESFFSKYLADDALNAGHCSNSTHAFQFDAWYDYKTPECRFIIPEQLVFKGRGQVQFVTQMLENSYEGWPCSDADASTKQDNCTTGGGEHVIAASGQCLCRTARTIYPLGVEDMTMSFDHTYEFPDGFQDLAKWKGSSTLDEADVENDPQITSLLTSTVVHGHKTDTVLGGGGAVSLTIKEWLEAAGTSLDDLNSIGGADRLERGGGGPAGVRLPHYRMTGMVVTVSIAYENGEPGIALNPVVNADVTASKQLLGWAGPGSERIHVVYPSGDFGAQTFHYVDRYQQGIVFNFQATGKVYHFDYMYLINTLISAVVLLGVAGTITDTVAFYCLPNGHSKVLASHRIVNVNKKQGFAELGIRTAIAARDFANFDPDHNMFVEAEDIVKTLSGVAGPGFTYKKKDADGNDIEVPFDCEKAHAIAIAILMDQHEAARASATSFDFLDYMRTQDNGTIPFPDFLQAVSIPTTGEWVPDEHAKRRVQEAWDQGLRDMGAGHQEKSLRRSMSRRVSATRGGSASALSAIEVDVTSNK